jgi:hypothetical protein
VKQISEGVQGNSSLGKWFQAAKFTFQAAKLKNESSSKISILSFWTQSIKIGLLAAKSQFWGS